MHRKHKSLRQRWQSWSTRRKALVAAPLAVLLLGGVAAAVLLFLAPIDGTVHVDGSPTFTYTSANVQSGSCTADVSAGTKATISWAHALPGDKCDLRVAIQIDGGTVAGGLALQSVSYDGSEVPLGFNTADTSADLCNGTAYNSGQTVVVPLELSVADGTAPGDYPAKSDAAVHFVRTADWQASACTNAS